MPNIAEIKQKIKKTFPVKQANVLVEVVDVVDETAKTSDFNELKAIVADLARSQKELAEAQKRTEQKVEELAEAQKETQREIKALVQEMRESRKEFGGFQRTMSYAFENEAYRVVPELLKKRYGIEIKEKIVRAEIGGKEINFFAKGTKDGREVYITGESKLKLDDRVEIMKINRGEEDVFKELEEKVKAVKGEYRDVAVVKLLVCHFATKGFIKMAEEKGVIVVQSFEW